MEDSRNRSVSVSFSSSTEPASSTKPKPSLTTGRTTQALSTDLLSPASPDLAADSPSVSISTTLVGSSKKTAKRKRQDSSSQAVGPSRRGRKLSKGPSEDHQLCASTSDNPPSPPARGRKTRGRGANPRREPPYCLRRGLRSDPHAIPLELPSHTGHQQPSTDQKLSANLTGHSDQGSSRGPSTQRSRGGRSRGGRSRGGRSRGGRQKDSSFLQASCSSETHSQPQAVDLCVPAGRKRNISSSAANSLEPGEPKAKHPNRAGRKKSSTSALCAQTGASASGAASGSTGAKVCTASAPGPSGPISRGSVGGSASTDGHTTGEAASRLGRSGGGGSGRGSTTTGESGSTASRTSSTSRGRASRAIATASTGGRRRPGGSSTSRARPSSSRSSAGGASAGGGNSTSGPSEGPAVSGPSSANNPPSEEDRAAQAQSASASGAQASSSRPAASSSGALSRAMASSAEDGDSDSDMSRLQALLEARGVPPHLFSALGPRMQQLLGKSMNSSTMTRAQQLLRGIEADGDEDQQLTSVMELRELLVMGNEDSLGGFPVKSAVPALIKLLRMEHNFDMMTNACRALTYLMEALPRSSAVVVTAIPAFLEKVKVIQCIDVAELALTALELLSRRHSKSILQAGGVAACLEFLEFFSITSQRHSLAITANCCSNVTSTTDFQFLESSLHIISSKLEVQDKKSVENCCWILSRLIDNLRHHSNILTAIASPQTLTRIQNVLMTSPPLISVSTFTMVIRMLVLMCRHCPELAVVLLKKDICDTLVYLLVGANLTSSKTSIELVSRTPQEVFEIVSLIEELMPELPTDGVFEVDQLLKRRAHHSQQSVLWQWNGDGATWNNFSPADCKTIETAYHSGDEDAMMSTNGGMYCVDFGTMQQINEDTGACQNVRRTVVPPSEPKQTKSAGGSAQSGPGGDARKDMLNTQPELATKLIQSLFGVLYEVYSSSAGPQVKHRCLQGLLRMVYYYDSSDLLQTVLEQQPISSHIASMLASQDLKVIVGALQMADILMQKLPQVFHTYFQRQGVTHQIRFLANSKLQATESKQIQGPCDASPSSSSSLESLVSSSSDLVSIRNYLKYEDSSGTMSWAGSSRPGPSSESPSEAAPPTTASDMASRAGRALSKLLNRKSSQPHHQSGGSRNPSGHPSRPAPHQQAPGASSAPGPRLVTRHSQGLSSGVRPSCLGVGTSGGAPNHLYMPPLPMSAEGSQQGGPLGGPSDGVPLAMGQPAPVMVGAPYSIPMCPGGGPYPSMGVQGGIPPHQHIGMHPHHLNPFAPNPGPPSDQPATHQQGGGPPMPGPPIMSLNPSVVAAPTPMGVPMGYGMGNLIGSNLVGGPMAVLPPSTTSRSSNPMDIPLPPLEPAGPAATDYSAMFSQPPFPTRSRYRQLQSGAPSGSNLWDLQAPPNSASSTASTSSRGATFLNSIKSMKLMAGRSHTQDGTSGGPHSGVSGLEPSARSKAPNTAALVNSTKEKVRAWVKEQAVRFLQKYFSEIDGKAMTEGALAGLCDSALQLGSNGDAVQAMKEVVRVLLEADPSPFEIIHSGLINKLFAYLANVSGDGTTSDLLQVPLMQRLRQFAHVFLNCPLGQPEVKGKGKGSTRGAQLSGRSPLVVHQKDVPAHCTLSQLTAQIMACLHQQEQFQVKVHDLGGTGGGRNTTAMKFLSTHQVKCQLARHPACTTLREWKGGPVKVEPLALINAIERFLVLKGYGNPVPSGRASEEDDSDQDLDSDQDAMAGILMPQQAGKHQLQFLIGDHCLPYNMTIYQAVRNYTMGQSGAPGGADTMDDTDSEDPLGSASIWTQTHTLWYRQAPDELTVPSKERARMTAASSKKTKQETKTAKAPPKGKKGDDLWLKGVTPTPCSPVISFLSPVLSDKLAVNDPSVDTLLLLRAIYGINKCWGSLYQCLTYTALLPTGEFLSAKLTAKANRQLQDPVVIMTGNIPQWLPQLASACPFLLPFDTRQTLFYTTAFDRDRAMMRLRGAGADNLPTDTTMDSARVAPRLERKKITMSRDNLLKQAEKVFSDMGGKKALLEVQYENEVGTGLGPTLEFYGLISRELQRVDLELWRNTEHSTDSGSAPTHVFASCGLYPMPLGRGCKASLVNKAKTKFKFLGKLMGKSLMDSRMLDINLSQVFYKWLLRQELTLDASDLWLVDKGLAQSYFSLLELEQKRVDIMNTKSMTLDKQREAVDALAIDDMSLDFILPGYPLVELMKGGKDIVVTPENLKLYLQLVSHWTLVEGVSRQMEAVREGFESVVPLRHLQSFYPEELDELFCGWSGGDRTSAGHSTQWDIRELSECCKPDHGYNSESQAVRWLYEILASYNKKEQRAFLSFVTGSQRLPVGGFKSLTPPLTIVKKTFEKTEKDDEFLPSVMTCVNYLKLPDYSSKEIMMTKLRVAADIGGLSFHLS